MEGLFNLNVFVDCLHDINTCTHVSTHTYTYTHTHTHTHTPQPTFTERVTVNQQDNQTSVHMVLVSGTLCPPTVRVSIYWLADQ